MLPALLVALLVAETVQDDPVVARYVLRDRPAVVTEPELALEVGTRHRASESGRNAIAHLVEMRLVEIEAQAAGIAPTEAEVEARIAEFERRLAQQGERLEDYLSGTATAVADFPRYVAMSLAHERLVMRALEVDDPGRVTPELLRLWLREAETRHVVVTDAQELPEAIVCRVDDTSFDLVDLGRLLLTNLGDDERRTFVRRIVLRRVLAEEARAHGIEITEEDARQALAERKARFAEDPRYEAASYEEWLRATQGMTVEELLRAPQFLANVRHERLVRLRYDAAALRERLEQDREAVLRRHGERRHVSIVLIRALEHPNEIVKRDFEAAEKAALECRAAIVAELRPFDLVARTSSEDPYSKVRGGELGAFFREDPSVPAPILEAAFALEPLEVSEPVRVDQGYVLVRVTEVEPAPDDAVLLERLREQLAEDLLRELVEAAEIELL